MPFLYTNRSGRRFPNKTLTVDVYASRLDQGILTPGTKSLGFKTYLEKTPSSPFFIDEEKYLDAFRLIWEQVVIEVAPKYGFAPQEALQLVETTCVIPTSSKPASLAELEALSVKYPAIALDPVPESFEVNNFAAKLTRALRQSSISKEFVSLEDMATRPTVQVNGLPSLSEDAAAETMSPSGVERKKLLLSKLREDAYPLHHEWVFWHERLDRVSSKSTAVEPVRSSPAQHERMKVQSTADLKGLENTSTKSDITATAPNAITSAAKSTQMIIENAGHPSTNSFPFCSHGHGVENNKSPTDKVQSPGGKELAYEDTLVPLMTTSTIKKFWETANNLDISTLRLRDSVHVFKKTVKPVWEDPRNVRGGSWTFRMNKNVSLQAWARFQVMAIGETLQDVLEPGDDICGVSIGIRFNSHLISVWNRDGSNQKSVDAIKACVLKELPEELRPTPQNIYYKKHSEHNGFSEAVATAKAKADAEKEKAAKDESIGEGVATAAQTKQ